MSYFLTELIFENRRYRPMDVAGDGNYLFHSLLLSNYILDYDHLSLRRAICDLALSSLSGSVHKIFEAIKAPNDDDDLSTHFKKMCVDGVFAGTTEMCMFYLLFKINVISFTNTESSITPHVCEKFDVMHFLTNSVKMDISQYNNNGRTIYVYHHEYMSPSTPAASSELNHFLYLEPVLINIEDDGNVGTSSNVEHQENVGTSSFLEDKLSELQVDNKGMVSILSESNAKYPRPPMNNTNESTICEKER